MEQLQLVANQAIIALPQVRGDRLVRMERELLFLPHVIRQGSFWPDNQHQPLACGDRVLNFLMKRQPARGHRHAVKPNLESAGREASVQPGHEGRGRIEWIDVITARVAACPPIPRRVVSLGVASVQ